MEKKVPLNFNKKSQKGNNIQSAQFKTKGAVVN